MRVETRKVADLKPADYNPRVSLTPSDPEWKRLAANLAEYGLVEPLVWNERTGNLVGGHQRLEILKYEGIKEVEVSIVDLDLEQEKALNLALNNPNLQSKWDPHKLIEMSETMDAHAIEIAGFDSAEDMHEIMRRHELQREGSFLGEFLDTPAVPPLPDQVPVGVGQEPEPRGSSGKAPEKDEDDEPEGDTASQQEPARSVEVDMKEPHKHLAGEQFFESKLVFTKEQREIWLRFVDRLKQHYGTDNTFEAVSKHCADFNSDWDARMIEEGRDTL